MGGWEECVREDDQVSSIVLAHNRHLETVIQRILYKEIS